MICSSCHQNIPDNATVCPYCGTHIQPAQPNPQQTYQQPYQQPAQPNPQPYQQPVQPTPQQPYQQPGQGMYQQSPQGMMPVAQLKTNRSFLKALLFALITFCIYPIVMYCGIANDVNTVCSRYDGKKTMHYFLMCLVSPFTLFILPLVWFHNICTRMGNELKRRMISYDFGAKDFWIFMILLSFTIAGPVIFAVKFIKASNLLNENYNQFG